MTTTTISQEQRAYAEGRIHAAGLQERVRVLGADYRELTGSYDRLASIEMIEAVGWEYFDAFFERCSALLQPDGLMFLQAIAIDDRAYEGEKSARSFSNTLIFPGGCLPSLGAISARSRGGRTCAPCCSRTSARATCSPCAIGVSAFWRHREQLAQLGYDERFRRLWEMYFAIAEAGFREARLRDLQLVYAKPAWPGASCDAVPNPRFRDHERVGSEP